MSKTLKEALAQPAQEPVAWLHPVNKTCVTTDPTAYARGIPLYTVPQQRKPLDDELITEVIDSMPKQMKGFMSEWDLYEFARAIKAILKEKNNGT